MNILIKFFFMPVFSITFLVPETIPLIMENDGVYFPMLLVSIISICSSYYIGAIGGIGNRGKMLLNVFDVNHLPERYKLFTRMFVEELW